MAIGDIKVPANFQINVGKPIDARTVVIDITERNSINSVIRYEGLTVYVESEEKNYQLQGGITNSDWIDLGSGGGSGGPASDVTFNNAGTGLDADNVQDAIEEINEPLKKITININNNQPSPTNLGSVGFDSGDDTGMMVTAIIQRKTSDSLIIKTMMINFMVIYMEQTNTAIISNENFGGDLDVGVEFSTVMDGQIVRVQYTSTDGFSGGVNTIILKTNII